jgi:hypothetical protein
MKQILIWKKLPKQKKKRTRAHIYKGKNEKESQKMEW